MSFAFGQRSLDTLKGVHPDLVRLAQAAIGKSSVDFAVIHGLRTPQVEAQMVHEHHSTTAHSRHLPNKAGYGCAIDVAAYVNGAIAWEPVSLYARINEAFALASRELKIPYDWGGAWATFKDYGHFQLPWSAYP